MDHIADTAEEGTPPGFAALWSDMPRDVMESVNLHRHEPATQARLTMQAPRARVEISIAPRGKGACAPAANQPPAQLVTQAAEMQEKDQTR